MTDKSRTTTTVISATLTSPPNETKPKKEKINLTEDEIDVLVFFVEYGRSVV